MRPHWLRIKLSTGKNFNEIKGILRENKLHTVCEEALCPNIGECFEQRTATFLILGDTCTRQCGFCAVKKGIPFGVEEGEPLRIAKAVKQMQLKYVVITSVTRDDLADGGASVYARTIQRIREYVKDCMIEVLIPDFGGSSESLEIILNARPDIVNHNIETVPRIYSWVRPMADYERSLELLKNAKETITAHPHPCPPPPRGRKYSGNKCSPPLVGGVRACPVPDTGGGGVLLQETVHEVTTKSGLMLGLSEEWHEIISVMQAIRDVGCDILTLGQYLSPKKDALPIQRYYTPEEFEMLKREGERMGFMHVESGPLVRSSYHAKAQTNALVAKV
ncbi:MAG TPA: lipoyl synthase [Candidatus Wunengus sp. YC63]|uniref:lipoyl synthase n=1 Tax=Candidatus Wunengus sp. YC63 TaxID=3367699 RepID=UPI00402925DA